MIDKRINVLMLEDSKTDELLVKRQLLKAAPNSLVTVARNKPEFLEKIEWSVPDLVLSDYNFPDMNGLEALLHVRQKYTYVPFIFVTGALNSQEEAANAILQGASGFVIKDNLKQLPDKIEEIWKRMDAAIEANAEEERRRRETSINLQKAMAILGKSPDFEQKDQIHNILHNVLHTIQD